MSAGQPRERVARLGLTETEQRLVSEALAVYAGSLVGDAGALRRRGYLADADGVEADRDLALLIRARVLLA